LEAEMRINCPITRDIVQSVFEETLFSLYGTRKSVLNHIWWESWYQKRMQEKRDSPASYRKKPTQDSPHADVIKKLLDVFPSGKTEFPPKLKTHERIDFYVNNVVVEVKSCIHTNTSARKAIHQAQRYAAAIGARRAVVFTEDCRISIIPRDLYTSFAELVEVLGT
jgi:hypothetical protein